MSKKKSSVHQLFHFSVRWTPQGTEDYTPAQFEEELQPFFRDIIDSQFDKWIFQIERGEKTKRLHFQAYAHRSEKMRANTLGGIIGQDCPGVEISAASTVGTNALKAYAMKKDTRVLGPWADKPIYMGHDLIKELRPWQSRIAKIITGKPDPRKIFWYYDSKGGMGKSSFAKYMYFHHKILTLTFGDAKDLLYVVQKFQNRPAYMFDLSRTKGGKSSMSEIYQALESVKNGYFISSKYESDVVLMQTPHCIVFSNHKPNMNALSEDRWVIIDMNDQNFLERAKRAEKIIGSPQVFGSVFQGTASENKVSSVLSEKRKQSPGVVSDRAVKKQRVNLDEFDETAEVGCPDVCPSFSDCKEEECQFTLAHEHGVCYSNKKYTE